MVKARAMESLTCILILVYVVDVGGGILSIPGVNIEYTGVEGATWKTEMRAIFLKKKQQQFVQFRNSAHSPTLRILN